MVSKGQMIPLVEVRLYQTARIEGGLAALMFFLSLLRHPHGLIHSDNRMIMFLEKKVKNAFCLIENFLSGLSIG